jgi:hypothetical protein
MIEQQGSGHALFKVIHPAFSFVGLSGRGNLRIATHRFRLEPDSSRIRERI